MYKHLKQTVDHNTRSSHPIAEILISGNLNISTDGLFVPPGGIHPVPFPEYMEHESIPIVLRDLVNWKVLSFSIDPLQVQPKKYTEIARTELKAMSMKHLALSNEDLLDGSSHISISGGPPLALETSPTNILSESSHTPGEYSPDLSYKISVLLASAFPVLLSSTFLFMVPLLSAAVELGFRSASWLIPVVLDTLAVLCAAASRLVSGREHTTLFIDVSLTVLCSILSTLT